MKTLFKWAGVGMLALGFFCWYLMASLPDGRLHVFMLNIGQGDAILIQAATGERVLVDGGPDDLVAQELSAVMPFYEKTIDVVILTHPHADHVDGLVEVLRRYDVKRVIMTGVSYNDAGYDAFLDQIFLKKVPVIFVDGKRDFSLGSLVFDMLFPLEPEQGKRFSNLNNSSIVFRLLYGKESFYFSGDLEKEGEAKLIESGLDLSADVLKAGHHGSRTASTESFLDLARPKIALISCGIDNKFKHPHAETLEHYLERNIETFRTDINGRIEVVSDGMSILGVKTETR